MTTDDQTEYHQVRCQPHLLALRMLARSEAATAFPRQVVAEVIRATKAVLAEAEAAGLTAPASAGDARGNPQAGIFLRVRLNRLAAAADDAIAAAEAGDSAQMRRNLSRFDALASAIWTVREAVFGPAPRRPARPGTAYPRPGHSPAPS